MSLLFLDGFDHYLTADLGAKAWVAAAGSPAISATQSRTGSQALRLTGNSDVLRRTVAAADEHATFTLGFAIRYDSISTIASLVSFESDAGATTHLTIVKTTAGLLRAYRGDQNGTLLGTSSGGALTAGVWNYLEVKVTLHDSTGVVNIRINGGEVLNLTGQDTKNAGTKTVFDGMSFRRSDVDSYYADDFYLANGAGSINNSFLGDIRVRTLYPSANGNSSQLLGSDADSTNNYQLVDEATPGLSDYVGSATVDQKDTYAFGDLSDTSGTVAGVQLNALATKTDAATRSLALVTRSGATDYDSGDTALALSTNSYVRQLRETDPATSAAWLRSAVNSAEFGAKVR